jgi:trigger factor
MQTDLETIGVLERRLSVTMPPEYLDEQVSRLSGNRVECIAGEPVPADLQNAIIQESLRQTLVSESLRPAGAPQIRSTQARFGEPLKYSASFEVYPDIDLRPLAGTVIQKPVVDISEADIDLMLEKLVAQRATWQAVERQSREGDRVIVDFQGLVDGRTYTGGKGSRVPCVLGSGSMLRDFEEGLIGLRAGESRHIDVNVPDDNPNREIAGKEVRFTVTIHSVVEPVAPDLDDSFAQTFGIDEGMEAFRTELRSMMESQLEQAVDARLKEQVVEALLAIHNITAPATLVTRELYRLKQQACEQQQGVDVSAADLPDSLFEAQANRQAVLGLLLSEVIRKHGLILDRERVSAELDRLAASYERPREFIDTCRSDPVRMQNLEGMVLEQQAVECLLEEADLDDIRMGFFDLVSD